MKTLKFGILFALFAITSLVEVHADDPSKLEAKRIPLDLIEAKAKELARAEDVLLKLQSEIAVTQDALKKAKRDRKRSYFVYGIPAAGLLAVSVTSASFAIFKDIGTSEVGVGLNYIAKLAAGGIAIGSAYGTYRCGNMIYLRRADVVRLEKSLAQLESSVQRQLESLKQKSAELLELKNTVLKN